jgi:hypothetical protein
MNEPLRPLTLGEILDRTAQLYRSRFLLFLGISVIPAGVVVVLACLVGLVVAWWSAAGAGSMPEEAGYVLVAIFCICIALVALPVLLAASALAMAAMSHAVSRVHLGQTTTIRDAYKSVWRKGWRYIGLTLLEGILIGGVPFAVYILLVILIAGGTIFARASGMGNIAGVGLFIMAVVLAVIAIVFYVFYMLIRLSLVFPACVVEQIGAWPAIKRSWDLSNGSKGRILLLYVLVGLLGWLLSMGISLPLLIIFTLLIGSGNPQHAQAASIAIIFISYGSSFAVQALVRPVYGIAQVLFYYDQRVRKEGYDIEWMMQAAGMAVAPPAAPQAAPRLTAAPGNPFVPAPEPPQDVEFPQASKPATPESGEFR